MYMKQYRDVCKKIINEGRLSHNRTGVDAISIFGDSIRVDLAKEFPAITCKRAFVRGAIGELNWMLSGSTNVLDLHKRNIHFWDQWAIKGEHTINKTVNEIKREFYAKSQEVWEHQIIIAKELGAADPIAWVCNDFNINMQKVIDDRFITVTPDVDKLTQFLIGKTHPDINNNIPLNAHTAKAYIYKIWDSISSDVEFEDIMQLLSTTIDKAFGGLFCSYSETDVIVAIMEATNCSREDATQIVGHHPLEKIIEQYKLPNVIKQQTCEVGELGPVYGYNWRNWETSKGEKVDQITNLINTITNNPTSRRHVLSFWNIEHLPDERYTPQENVARGRMALAPCHWMCEFDVQLFTTRELIDNLRDAAGIRPHFGLEERWTDEGIRKLVISHNLPIGKLNIHPHMRSWDFPAGAPVNLVFYAALCHMVAQQTNLTVGDMWFTASNIHMYVDQVDIMKQVIELPERPTPTFKLTEHPKSIFEYSDSCYQLENYDPHPTVRVPVAL